MPKFIKTRKMKRLENGNVEDRPHFIVSITVNFLVSDSAPSNLMVNEANSGDGTAANEEKIDSYMPKRNLSYIIIFFIVKLLWIVAKYLIKKDEC